MQLFTVGSSKIEVFETCFYDIVTTQYDLPRYVKHVLGRTGLSLTQKEKKKSRPEPGNFKRARGHSMCSTMVVAVGGWRLAACGGWQLATGGWWRLVVVGGGWWLAVGGWRQLAVVGSWRLVAAGGWRRLVAGGWWRLVVGGWWRLVVDGSWRLAVGGPLGLSLRAVLSKKKKKIVP